MKNFFLCLLSVVLSAAASAQSDTLPGKKDSLQKDSLVQAGLPVLIQDSLLLSDTVNHAADSLYADSLMQIRRFDSLKKLKELRLVTQDVKKEGEVKNFSGKEWLFYYCLFLFLLFGLFRRVFSKYFYDLFRVFFKTTLKQRQVREQLLQSPLPSVMMNIFFVLVAGLYINYVLIYFQLSVHEDFWMQYVYCSAALGAIYLLKFTGLKFAGWLFNVSEAADSYIFIVFIINKMIGMVLLPLLLFLAFSTRGVFELVMILSWIILALLLIYRFILSYSAARNEIKLNSFHFVLYIIGFEVIPLLLIYKMLLFIF
jgi:hypothetical protein